MDNWSAIAQTELASIGAVLSASANEEKIGEGLIELRLSVRGKEAFMFTLTWSAYSGGVDRDEGVGTSNVGLMNIPMYYSVMMQLAEPLLQWLEEDIARRVQCN